MEQRTQGKKRAENRGITCRSRAAAVCAAVAFCLFLTADIRAGAAQARLVSASSPVYAEADGGSAAIGNLVQGNTFELHEKMTNDQGETWYLVTTGNGTRGYIRGEISEMAQDAASAGAADTGAGDTSAQAGAVDAGAGEDGAQAGAAEDAVSDENPDAGAPEEGVRGEEMSGTDGTGAAVPPQPAHNTQQKTYSVRTDADKFRTQAGSGQTLTAAETPEAGQIQAALESGQRKPVPAADRALLLLVFLAVSAAGLLRYSLKQLKRQAGVPRRPAEAGKKKKTKRGRKNGRRKRQTSG